MCDTPVQPSSRVQTPERHLRGFLHVYRNTVTSLISFFSQAPSQGRIYSPWSPEVFPVYTFPSHVEDSFWVYYCCRICPSAQAAASYSLHETSLCHLMFSGSLHYVLSSQTQKNEAAETFLIAYEDLWCFPKQKLGIRRSITIFMWHKPLWRVSIKIDVD